VKWYLSFSSKWACLAFALLGLIGVACADESAKFGRQVFERCCRTCHGGTAPADSPIGPSLAGIVGKRAATQPSGVHSRALIDSGIVWDRDSLRRFLADPSRAVPGTIMPVRVVDPAELESLLDYLESAR
jgi:cytochrome c